MAGPKTSVSVRQCIKAMGDAGERLGVALEPWSERHVREGVLESMIRAEDKRGTLAAKARGGVVAVETLGGLARVGRVVPYLALPRMGAGSSCARGT